MNIYSIILQEINDSYYTIMKTYKDRDTANACILDVVDKLKTDNHKVKGIDGSYIVDGAYVIRIMCHVAL